MHSHTPPESAKVKLRGDNYYGYVLVDQCNGSVFQLSRSIALCVDVRDFF